MEQLCDYGCGQLAKYQFKNGKNCCSMWWNLCPAKKKGFIKEDINPLVDEEIKQEVIENKPLTKEEKLKKKIERKRNRKRLRKIERKRLRKLKS